MKIFLHGNFEAPSDWEFLGADWQVFPLWEFIRQTKLRSWDEFSDVIVENFQKSGNAITHIAGYSLGGRILLNLMNAGLVAERCTFISTHPGLKSEDERTERLWNDLQWKEKVLTENWEDLAQEWNSQEIFARDLNTLQNFSRLENYRAEIAHAFDILSLGRMRDFAEVTLKINGEWICGELDSKFSNLGAVFTQRNPLEFVVFPNASHRIHKKDSAGLSKLLNCP